jgi:dihydroxyacetone kinase
LIFLSAVLECAAASASKTRERDKALAELLMHALQEAGAAKLMTPELIATLADHALCRTRHSACYAAQRTMPNQFAFPQDS